MARFNSGELLPHFLKTAEPAASTSAPSAPSAAAKAPSAATKATSTPAGAAKPTSASATTGGANNQGSKPKMQQSAIAGMQQAQAPQAQANQQPQPSAFPANPFFLQQASFRHVVNPPKESKGRYMKAGSVKKGSVGAAGSRAVGTAPPVEVLGGTLHQRADKTLLAISILSGATKQASIPVAPSVVATAAKWAKLAAATPSMGNIPKPPPGLAGAAKPSAVMGDASPSLPSPATGYGGTAHDTPFQPNGAAWPKPTDVASAAPGSPVGASKGPPTTDSSSLPSGASQEPSSGRNANLAAEGKPMAGNIDAGGLLPPFLRSVRGPEGSYVPVETGLRGKPAHSPLHFPQQMPGRPALLPNKVHVPPANVKLGA